MSAPANPSSNRPLPRLRLRLAAAAERQLRAGHPWVFADSIRDQNRTGAPGELAVMYDRSDRFLAVGFYDPASPIRVRVLQTGTPRSIDASFWEARLDAALARRADLFDKQTNGYRLINGESDGWPGLVLDRYHTTLVLKVYTEAWRTRLAEIGRIFVQRLSPAQTILRLSRKLHGANAEHPTPNPAEAAAITPWLDGCSLTGGRESSIPQSVVFLETGLRFEAEVRCGQKTGFFLDQRENRRLVESLATGRTVLNAFSFSGGFSLYAARGGARSVTDLDISRHALESAQRNFVLNAEVPKIAHCAREQIAADAFAWFSENRRRQFDLIVLDPPSLAKRETERMGAIRAYARLAGHGIHHLATHGLLVACSCSAHVSAEEFIGAVRLAAKKSGRKFQQIKRTGHAPDHPAVFPEAEYLKAIYLKFD